MQQLHTAAIAIGGLAVNMNVEGQRENFYGQTLQREGGATESSAGGSVATAAGCHPAQDAALALYVSCARTLAHCLYTRMHTYTYTFMYTRMHTCTYTCMYAPECAPHHRETLTFFIHQQVAQQFQGISRSRLTPRFS